MKERDEGEDPNSQQIQHFKAQNQIGFNSNNNQNLLSKIATKNGHGENSPYFDGWKAYDNNPYHPTQNPTGVIQMGLAENELCFDLIKEWVVNNPKASICTAEGANEFKDIAIYQDYHGLPEFRKGVAKFMGKVRGDRVTFDPDRIVLSGGATAGSFYLYTPNPFYTHT
ncbi:hypothetical protein ACSBR1_038783 [Camellia fascicularis]